MADRQPFNLKERSVGWNEPQLFKFIISLADGNNTAVKFIPKEYIVVVLIQYWFKVHSWRFKIRVVWNSSLYFYCFGVKIESQLGTVSADPPMKLNRDCWKFTVILMLHNYCGRYVKPPWLPWDSFIEFWVKERIFNNDTAFFIFSWCAMVFFLKPP